MNKLEITKINEIIKLSKKNDPSSIQPIFNSLLASKIRTILDAKKDELMQNY